MSVFQSFRYAIDVWEAYCVLWDIDVAVLLHNPVFLMMPAGFILLRLNWFSLQEYKMDESVARRVMPVSCTQHSGFKNIDFGTKLFPQFKWSLLFFLLGEKKFKKKPFSHAGLDHHKYLFSFLPEACKVHS